MKQLLEKISSLRVLVIGDAMLDHYIIGDAVRISPEAPVPVVDIANDKYVLGACANVAMNLVAIGANVEVCSMIGDGFAGNKIEELLKTSGITFNKKFKNPDIETIIKTRVLVRGQQLCRLDREQHRDKYSLKDPVLLDYILDKISECDVVILSDYAKGVLSNDNVQLFIDTAHQYGKFIALDPKPKRKLNFKHPDLITPNLTEACVLAEVENCDFNTCDMELICSEIYRRYEPRILVITMGEHGMLLSEKGKVVCIIPTYAREVFDVSGAGDTSVACLSAALGVGEALKPAAHFANIAAGIVVGKVGTATVSPEEILNFYIE